MPAIIEQEFVLTHMSTFLRDVRHLNKHRQIISDIERCLKTRSLDKTYLPTFHILSYRQS